MDTNNQNEFIMIDPFEDNPNDYYLITYDCGECKRRYYTEEEARACLKKCINEWRKNLRKNKPWLDFLND